MPYPSTMPNGPQLEIWQKVIGFVLAIFTLIGVLYKFWGTWLKKRVEAWRNILAAFVSLPKIQESVGFLSQQFTPDGGNSFIDTVNANALKLEYVVRQQGQQTSMLHSVMETVPEAIVWFDDNREISVISQGFMAMTGMDINAMRNDGWKRIISKKDLERVEKRMAAAMESRKVFYDVFHVCNQNHPEREDFEVEVTGVPLPLAGGWKFQWERTADMKDGKPTGGMAIMPTMVPVGGKIA